MEDPIHERARELCAKALAAPPSEAEPILKELQELLHDHNRFVRSMAARVLKHLRSDTDAA
jgi:HEAT repeat protein